MITTFWLVLGYACNNRCHHCYAISSRFRSGKWMDFKYAAEIMKTLKQEAKTCLLLGGEPTLCPELEKFISFGAEIGLKMVIVSNGRKLKDRGFTRSLFSAGLDRAVISLEGANRVTHNFLTGCSSFKDTLQGIEICSEEGRVNTLTTICKGNSHQIPEIVRFACQLGVEKPVLNCAIPVLDVSQSPAGYILNPDELAKVVNEAFHNIRRAGLSFQLNATFPICLLEKEVLAETLELGWLSVGCHMYRGEGVVFDPDGNILPCTHFSEAPLVKNVRGQDNSFMLKNNFYENWYNPKSLVGTFRSKLWRYPARRCAECKYWGGCIGGCPLLWAFFNPVTFIDKNRRW